MSAARTGVAVVAVITVVANVSIGWGWPIALSTGLAVLVFGELAGWALGRMAVRRAAAPGPAPAIAVPSHEPLTRRETEVALLVATGLSNKEVSRRLFIGEKTVERHLDNINKKLDLHSRVELANWVRDRRLHELRTADEDPMRASPDS